MQAEGYPGFLFEPIKILPKKAGTKLHDTLRELDLEYRKASAKLKEEFDNKLRKILPEAVNGRTTF